jgi:hypothetical protein
MRLQKILQGAFSKPPTPLKNVPKKRGGSRFIAASREKREKQKD